MATNNIMTLVAGNYLGQTSLTLNKEGKKYAVKSISVGKDPVLDSKTIADYEFNSFPKALHVFKECCEYTQHIILDKDFSQYSSDVILNWTASNEKGMIHLWNPNSDCNSYKVVTYLPRVDNKYDLCLTNTKDRIYNFNDGVKIFETTCKDNLNMDF